jgi:hypothetical protein
MKYKQVAETLDGLEFEIRRISRRNSTDVIQERIVLFRNAQAAIWIGLKEHERDITLQYLYVFVPSN